jgi:hypothetical protein
LLAADGLSHRSAGRRSRTHAELGRTQR